MNVMIKYARVVTPVYTYLKHTFSADDGAATVSVLNPRTHEQMNTLTAATVEHLGAQLYRIEGTNPAGEHVVWTADTLGCGCRNVVKIIDTDMGDIPT